MFQSLFVAAIAASSALVSASAIPAQLRATLPSSSEATPKAKHLAFPVKSRRDGYAEPLQRRATVDTESQVYNFSSISYSIELEIGEPPQLVEVGIDTGSSELWVNPNCKKALSKPQIELCENSGQYIPTKSKTAKVLKSTHKLRYGIGEGTAQNVIDKIRVPDTDISLDSVTFSFATDTTDLNQGILGLSYGKGFNGMTYNSLLQDMVDQDIINSEAFGVSLGSQTEKAHSGVLAFGAVDIGKFSGKLHTEPILDPIDTLYRYWVQMYSMGVTLNGKSTEIPDSSTPVFFDTGATLSQLPASIVKGMVKIFDAKLDKSSQMYFIDCDSKGTVDFTFGEGYTVKVPIEEFIFPREKGCALGVQESSQGLLILGASFLRGVYTVFDLETNALHFAEYKNCGTELVTIEKGSKNIAKMEGKCGKTKSSKTGGDKDDTKEGNASETKNDQSSPSSSSGSSSENNSGGSSNSDSEENASVITRGSSVSLFIAILAVTFFAY